MIAALIRQEIQRQNVGSAMNIDADAIADVIEAAMRTRQREDNDLSREPDELNASNDA